MKGLYSGSKDLIEGVIETLFDRVAFNLIGFSFKNRKIMTFSSQGENMGLAKLFIEALGNRYPTHVERDIMKNLLSTTSSYLDGLKGKMKAQISNEIDSYVKEQQIKGEPISELAVQQRLIDGLVKAKNGIKTIAAAETTKVRNVGQMTQVTKVAADMGVSDPTVFFIIIRDNVTCGECLRLHMMPDKNTPRVYKLSELSHGYHKKGDNTPSICGEHPHCRCTLTFLPPTYGFKNGRIKYIGQGHDEWAVQRGEDKEKI